jgi:hypothetical protein
MVPASEFGENPHAITLVLPGARLRCDVKIELLDALATRAAARRR